MLVGSMGMAALGVIRATRDMDGRSLRSSPIRSIEEITSTDLAGDYPAIQYVPRTVTSRSICSRVWVNGFDSTRSSGKR